MRTLLRLWPLFMAALLGAGCSSLPEMDLITAIGTGHARVVQARIHEGAEVNGHQVRRTEFGEMFMIPLHLAASDASCYAGTPLPPCPISAAIVRLLLDGGADPNAWDDHPTYAGWNTALMIAASEGNAEVVRMLLEAGADVNAQSRQGGWTALMQAAASRQRRPGRSGAEVVRMLLEAGANVHSQRTESQAVFDRLGRTALEIATVSGAPDAVLLALREHGAELEWTDHLDKRVREEAAYRESVAQEEAAIQQSVRRQLEQYEGSGSSAAEQLVGAIVDVAETHAENQGTMGEALASDEALVESLTRDRRIEAVKGVAGDDVGATRERALVAPQRDRDQYGRKEPASHEAVNVDGLDAVVGARNAPNGQLAVVPGTVEAGTAAEEARSEPGKTICGVPRDEALAVTKQDSQGEWAAAGPIQELMLSDNDTEREALAYVARNYTTSEDPDTGRWTRVALKDGYSEPTFVCKVTYKGDTVRLHRLHETLEPYDDDVRRHITSAPF